MGVSAETGVVGDLYCPTCERTFEVGERCPEDNTRLVRIAQQSDQLIGRDLDGRYTIVEKLGQGGMGTVFRGTQHSVGREVAIKVVTPSLVTEPVTIKRFLREATIASRLSHPNAVSVLDFGQTKDGLFYLVMELVTGRTLDVVVEKDGRLSPARIVRIGAQICDALEGAHQLQIIHRDLKPQNVIVLSTGRDLIKVLDFGLAKSLSKDIASSTMTNAGALLGSPAFMPPEVVTGQTSDARADLYSLGCLLHYCASGELPFQAATIHELIAMHASEPAKRLTNIPGRLATVIKRLLAKNPDDRYASASATREALEESAGKTIPPANVPAPRAAPIPEPPPENDTSSSTVLGWDGASSGKPAPRTPSTGPVRHSGVRTPATGVPVRPTPVARPITPSTGTPSTGGRVPADPRMITATPVDPRTRKPIEPAPQSQGPSTNPTAPFDPRVGTNPAAAPFDPRVGTNPAAAPFDPRVGTNPAAAPFDPRMGASPQGAPFDPRIGTNPSASPFNPSTNSQGAPFDPRMGASPQGPFDPRVGTSPQGPFDPRVGTNPSASPFNPSTNSQGAPFDPRVGTSPQGPFDPRVGTNPQGPFDPRVGTNPSASPFNPSTNSQGAPFDPRSSAPNPMTSPKRSTALFIVIALLVVAAGGAIAFFAMGGA